MTTEYMQAQDFKTFLFNDEIADLHGNRNNIPSPSSDEMELTVCTIILLHCSACLLLNDLFYNCIDVSY